MTPRAPLVIVTLPGRNISSLRAEIETARSAGGDSAEVRLDRLDPGELERLGSLFPSPLPLLATLRSRAEGGEGPDDARERIPRLLRAAALPFEWIDLEFDRDRELFDRLRPPRGLIVSTHLPNGADPAELARRLRQVPPGGALRKIVLPASIGALLSRVLPALPPPGELALVVLTTGPSAPLLRAWSKALGWPVVFSALPEGPPGVRGPPPVEGGQIPVDRLRWTIDAVAEAPLFGIAGHPVAHSASPFLHSRWMRSRGHRGLYVPLDFASDEEFVDSLRPLAERGFRGLNVTHPYKETAFAAASRVGRGAEACGVANCLSFRGEEVEAENTDLAAILRRLGELRSSNVWNGRGLTVLGAGGSARATLAAAREIGVAAHVIARRSDAAEALAGSFGAEVGAPESAADGDLVVHATEVGREGAGALEVPLASLLGPGTHVLDWVYRPIDPIVRTTAEREGASYEDGWRLLVYQASASYAIWWESEPSPEQIADAIEVGA